MEKGRIRHMFPGGNTSKGFYSFYNYILLQEEARRIFVIKGGPGVGKSTFMRKTALELFDRGYDVEFMHCSSDYESLDGIVVPKLGISMIDGTAPHIVDPKNPGAVDEIIHLGDFWKEEGMRADREAILKDNKEVGRLFARAYRYINAASSIYEDTAVINGWAMDFAQLNAAAARLIDDFFVSDAIAEKEGNERKLFASALTPKGMQNFLDTILTGKICAVMGGAGTGTDRLLEKIKTAAIERGFYTEAYYCPLNPAKLEHLVIPDKGIAFTTENKYHKIEKEVSKRIDLNSYLDITALQSYSAALEYNEKTFEALLQKGIDTIAQAKAIHDHMETYYIPNMDFDAVQRCWESTMARILEYAREV
ncbi:MAG: ATPase [Ruminiclostridium sp.]|nr:ATPase [Ruminiclostridium sp.]